MRCLSWRANKETVFQLFSAKCASDEFQCGTNPGQCILSAYVCDGYPDCSNNADEDNCSGQANINLFRKHSRVRLDVPYLERWLQTTAQGCAKYCIKAKGQLISKCPFGVFKSPKKPMKIL